MRSIGRALNPIQYPDGHVEVGPIWTVHCPTSDGQPGECVIERPGGIRSVVNLVRVVALAISIRLLWGSEGQER